MITVNQNPGPEGLVIELAGSVEEQTQFEQQIGPVSGKVTFNLKGIIRINSVGVKAWIAYFQGLKAKGVDFSFEECAPAIVDQLNMITNFAAGGKVKSILLPFACNVCGKHFVGVGDVEQLKANQKKIPDLKCERADCGAQFDDDENDYLYFIK
jgi:hypothetical protein